MAVHIRTRIVKSGKRYQVRYRLGGRDFPVLHAGTFLTMREAKLRRDLVAGWIAAGHDPRVLLDEIRNPVVPEPPKPIEAWCDSYLDSRIDLTEKTKLHFRGAFAYAIREFPGRDPFTLTVADCRDLVGTLDRALAPTTARLYIYKFRQFLDYVGLVPNPARDKSVKLPRLTHVEHVPPTADHVLAILENIPARWRLPLVLMEQTAMRPGEIETLVWGDVDLAGARFRLRAEETKTSRSRWVQVPGWLIEILEASVPYDDRTDDGRVFEAFTVDGAGTAVRRACKRAGIPHYTPRGLRHRRASLWHGQGVSARELAERGGWSKATVPLEVYSHVLIDTTEVPAERLAAVLS